MAFALGALEFGMDCLVSIQNSLACLCNVKPLLVPHKPSHRVETDSWINDKRIKKKKGKVKFSLQLGRLLGNRQYAVCINYLCVMEKLLQN